MPIHDTIIIGAGPAGIAAAIQLKRSGFNPVVFEKKHIGGLLNNANMVENYPGFPGGIAGRELTALFLEQLKSFNINIINEQVESVDYRQKLFSVQTVSGIMESSSFIIASGTKPKRKTNFKIKKNIENRVFYEVVDLLNLTDKKIAIIGAGDAAFDYALSLSGKNEIVILNRGEKTKCLPLLYERAKQKNSINYLSEIQIFDIAETPNNRLSLKCNNKGDNIDIVSDYVILAFGREVDLGFMTENLMRQRADLEKKELLHFVGDVNGRLYRQTAIAVGEGVLAAMKIAGRKRNKAV